MRWILGAAAAWAMLPIGGGADARPMLYDAVALNIGVNCQWQARCMGHQRMAMNRALTYVTKERPPQWRVQLCNRNASRGGYRVDWIGYDNCIRNASIRADARSKRTKR